MPQPPTSPFDEPDDVSLPSATEPAFRDYFLSRDRRDAAIAIGVFAFFKASFSAFDLIFQSANQAVPLLEARFGFALASLLAMLLVLRVSTWRRYDALMLAWALLAVLSNFYTIAHRPQDHFGFLSTSPMLILLLFVFFRNRLAFQGLAASLLLATDFYTIFALREPLPTVVLIQSVATYGLSMVIGVIAAVQLQNARRQFFATHRREQQLHTQLQLLAYHDELTGVLNRRRFLLEAGQLWQEAQRSGQPACLLMLDLDHFKAINDRLGHDAGDQALRAFAHLVQSSKRPGDVFGRIGGEEFALLLPQANSSAARDVATRLIRECQSLRTGEACGSALTVSIGLAVVTAGDSSLQATMARADHALYQAKSAGRARVVMAS